MRLEDFPSSCLLSVVPFVSFPDLKNFGSSQCSLLESALRLPPFESHLPILVDIALAYLYSYSFLCVQQERCLDSMKKAE